MSVVTVTGGSGFIGFTLVRELFKLGCHIHVVDRVPPKEPLPAGVSFELADIGDATWRYAGPRPEVLYHLAAEPWSMIKGGSWLDGSRSAYLSNTFGTFNVLQLMKPGHVVFSSTANLYGEGRLLKEDSPVKITSHYGYSKWLAEEAIRKSGVPYTIFRFGTVAGPRGRTFPNRLAWSALKGLPVKIFNGGESLRDIVDVRDIARTVAQGPTYVAEEPTFNLAMGTEISGTGLADYASRVAESYGLHLEAEPVDFAAPGYVKESTLDCSKIRSLGWEPRFGHHDIFESIFEYYLRTQNPIEPPSWETL